MSINLTAINFNISRELEKLLIKQVKKLNRILKNIEIENETLFVTLLEDKRRRTFTAKILVHIPNHRFETSEVGISPEEAVGKAVDQTKRIINKYKDRTSDQHFLRKTLLQE